MLLGPTPRDMVVFEGVYMGLFSWVWRGMGFVSLDAVELGGVFLVEGKGNGLSVPAEYIGQRFV